MDLLSPLASHAFLCYQRAMSDDNKKSGGGKGRPPRGPGFGRDRNGPPRGNSRGGPRPEGRGFKGPRAEGGRFDRSRSEGRPDRPASGEAMIKGAFRPRKPREEGSKADSGPRSESRSFSDQRERDGGKRRFSPTKGPRRSFSDRPDFAKSGRPPRERGEGDDRPGAPHRPSRPAPAIAR